MMNLDGMEPMAREFWELKRIKIMCLRKLELQNLMAATSGGFGGGGGGGEAFGNGGGGASPNGIDGGASANGVDGGSSGNCGDHSLVNVVDDDGDGAT